MIRHKYTTLIVSILVTCSMSIHADDFHNPFGTVPNGRQYGGRLNSPPPPPVPYYGPGPAYPMNPYQPTIPVIPGPQGQFGYPQPQHGYQYDDGYRRGYRHNDHRDHYYDQDRYDRGPDYRQRQEYPYGQQHEFRWQQNRYSPSPRFEDHHRMRLHDHYDNLYRSGQCPPGLRSHHGGCGVAHHHHANHAWAIGQPLPHQVTYYNLDPHVVSQIGYAPSGYQYVRVGTDILMVSIGNRLVVDAISDW